MRGLLGRKIGMTTYFAEDGTAHAVTVIQAGPCWVVQRKTEATDGYNALQIGFEPANPRRVKKPMQGHFRRAGVKPARVLREIRVQQPEAYHLGQEFTVEMFQVGERVDVIGTSKGRGFAGVIKRWGFSGNPGSHGSKIHRRPASIGPSGPLHVWKGKRMAGHMGHQRVTVRHLKVVAVDPERHLLVVEGAVPGPNGGLLLVRAPGDPPPAQPGQDEARPKPPETAPETTTVEASHA